MSCPFCAIVAGDEPATIVDETEETLAFAPLDPVSEGHLLVVPKAHYESLFDIPRPALDAVVAHTKTIACRLRAAEFDGVNLLHASGEAAQQSVSHFHLHVAPRRADDCLDLWPESGHEETNASLTYEHVRRALEEPGDGR
ncbi:HIT family hydrolase, diadenosine tetraphosphate hydrolase [Halovivax ruber XH-70]|uniref:HIT family hydrolase, diadenosine tetraphosphate hydrolase n=1 Tax=Halovivax ruber (strain DSM 18193 / JCM 13892 / XH-70) TaxID=797302 RepID=L0IBP3_HALRX|nr:HIT domain-containing protein [Halovivax ruber]AGB16985.1 HIT family hydrolase, diadenosine tetraphosphate hydrolase [Halovivax ruber XH-70]